MPGLDGFEVIEALADPSPVIFVTAYDEYAIRAFEVNALDYLLKPFGRERLERAIRRTLAELEARLDPACFFRAHRSAIVNLDRVKEVIPWFKRSHKLRLTTGAEVELSRARARTLRKILGW